MAALMVIDPPQVQVPRGLLWAAGVLILLAATAFLPAAWFGDPVWRRDMVAAGIPISGLASPQPWISAECLILMLAGLCWIWWLSSQTWGVAEKRSLIETFVYGAAVIAAVAIAAFYSGNHLPFWHSERGFGPFPNRNQTGNFFAISGILALACTYENLRGRKIRALWFVLASALICMALVLSYSRAAVILFFAGSLVWVASLGFMSRSPKGPAVCASLLVVAASAFLLFGGATLERLQSGNAITLGFRKAIYADAFSLIRASPWNGVGPGNFEGVFALFRKASAMPSRILHPESDWLWLWAEMGWLAVATVVAALVPFFSRVFPLTRGTNRRLRTAAAAAALVFVVHGFVDVPGHRLGSALPGLFVLAMAINTPAVFPENRRVVLCARIAAAIFGVAGLVWIVVAASSSILPGHAGVERIRQQSQDLAARQQYSAAVQCVAPAIRWAPLDWRLYFIRATAEASDGNWPRAYDDFRRVEMLESTSPMVTFDEGRTWLSSRPSYAIPPWRETLRRAPRQDGTQFYAQMLGYADGNPPLRRMLRSLAKGRTDLELTYLDGATGDELKAGIASLLRSDPDLHSLDDARKIAFFRLWVRSDGAGFVQRLAATPAWGRLAWRSAAALRAAQGDLRGASGLALQFMPKPALPGMRPSSDVNALRRRLLEHPRDFLAGYALYEILSQKDEAAALLDIRRLTSLPECPKYFYYLEAGLAYRTGDFPGAWKALQKYEPITE